MRLSIVTPASRSRKGNWITASRWRRMLTRLGHRVAIEAAPSSSTDVLIALHARKSFAAIECFHREHPDKPLIVALTGTDLYGDLAGDPRAGDSTDRERASQALRWADRVVLFQAHGLGRLPDDLRAKSRVVSKSAIATRSEVAKSRRTFDVCVVGHLRPVKDPFRTAQAARRLPADSRVRVLHAGGALEPSMEERARREMTENPRYVWLGERPQWQVRRLLKRCRLMVLTSEMEGGANALAEAVVAGTAILSTRISGSLGMLGDDHPGYFEVGDTDALASRLLRAEQDPGFVGTLEACSRELAPRFHPDRELDALRQLLAELQQGRAT